MDRYGDHALACPRTGLPARRAKLVERAWVRVAREAVGAEGQVVPQQRLAHTTATGVPADDRHRLDLVVIRRIRGHRQWRSAVLRRNTGVPPYKNGSPASLHR